MAYRYHTIGSAALKPEQTSATHEAHIIDFETLDQARFRYDVAVSTRSFNARIKERLLNDELLGAIPMAFRTSNAIAPKANRRQFALAFAAVFSVFLLAILMGA